MKGETHMSDFRKSLALNLEDPEFKKEYENLEDEYQLTRALIAARIEANMTQKELAEKSGIRQSNISRIENGNCTPTLDTLRALANALGKQLVINFQ